MNHYLLQRLGGHVRSDFQIECFKALLVVDLLMDKNNISPYRKRLFVVRLTFVTHLYPIETQL